MKLGILSMFRKDDTEARLSAYVDGTLDDVDRERLEAEIRRSPELARRVELLRVAVEVLRSADPVRAPRSFALTPEMAYGSSRPSASPRLVFLPLAPAVAAAAAALAFGILLVGNLTGSLRQSGSPAGAAERAAVSGQLDQLSAPGPSFAAPLASATAAPDTQAPLALVTGVPVPTGEAQRGLVEPSGPAGPAGFTSATSPAGATEAIGGAVESTLDATQESITQKTAETAPEPAMESREPESGLGLPLWQLETATGVLAGALAATALAFAYLKRRAVRLH